MLVALARRTRHNRPHGSGSFYQAGFALGHGGDAFCLRDRQKPPATGANARAHSICKRANDNYGGEGGLSSDPGKSSIQKILKIP